LVLILLRAEGLLLEERVDHLLLVAQASDPLSVLINLVLRRDLRGVILYQPLPVLHLLVERKVHPLPDLKHFRSPLIKRESQAGCCRVKVKAVVRVGPLPLVSVLILNLLLEGLQV